MSSEKAMEVDQTTAAAGNEEKKEEKKDEGPSVLDLAFAMDCTGSMGSYIDQARRVSVFGSFLAMYI